MHSPGAVHHSRMGFMPGVRMGFMPGFHGGFNSRFNRNPFFAPRFTPGFNMGRFGRFERFEDRFGVPSQFGRFDRFEDRMENRSIRAFFNLP
jgi:hypothetical protein